MPIGTLPGYISAVRGYAANPLAQKRTQQALAGLLPPTSSTFARPGIQTVIPTGGQRTNVSLGYQPPAAPATGGGGGTRTTTVMTPNQVYEGEILNDPRSIGAQQAFDATTAQLQNTRRAQFRQALISSGYDPGPLPADLADYAGDIDQTTRDAAAANQLSSRAQLNKALGQATTDLPYLLAARGVARSGALPVGQTSLQEQYQTQAQSGLSDLLSALRGYGSEYAGGYNQAVQGLNAAREAVAQRLAQMAGYSQTTTTEDLGGEGVTQTNPEESGGYAPMYAPNYAPRLQTSDPFTASAIQKIITPTRGRVVPKNIFQIARNVRAG